jgi:AcrR family transcriptional regulator
LRAYLKTMVFETHTLKSAVQLAVEAVLAQPASRLDSQSRRQRAIAATVMECSESGYAATKIASIAKRAQVSSATIYRDFGNRDGLLLEALQWVIGLFAQNWISETSEVDPVKRIEALLLSHGKALADPFMGWIFRLYVHLANTTAPHLLPIARTARDANLGFWIAEIARLEALGQLVPTDHKLTAAILLGAIERRSIFARLAFGEVDDHQPNLSAVAEHAALALFQVFGTQAFWADRLDEPAIGWLENRPADHGQKNLTPKALMDAPSGRLTAFAQRVLSRDVNRLDSDARKVRIQLAAMLECIDVGYEDATMASVAMRAGVSTATFYNDYPDKRALFIDAMVLQARFRVDYNSLIDQTARAEDTISDMVFSIANVLADPNFLWFHRVSMASDISNAPELIQSSRETRAHTEGFWYDYITSLEASGVLQQSNQALTMNLLLGATQRRSVLSMVFFGANDVSEQELSQLALASTDFVLRLVGTKVPDHLLPGR